MTKSPKEERGPERQCLACRERAHRDDLLRLVRAPDGPVVVDLRARLPGRGAWIHASAACIDLVAKKPGLLARALRGTVLVGDLARSVRSAVEVALLDGLSLAAAGGALVGGHDALLHRLQQGQIAEVAFASDIAPRTQRSLERAASDVPITMIALDRARLGAQIGASTRAAVGVLPIPAAVHLRRQLQRLRRLG